MGLSDATLASTVIASSDPVESVMRSDVLVELLAFGV